MSELKSGFKTSEFLTTVITIGLSLIPGMNLPAWTIPIISGLYGISRGLAKGGIIRGSVGQALNNITEK